MPKLDYILLIHPVHVHFRKSEYNISILKRGSASFIKASFCEFQVCLSKRTAQTVCLRKARTASFLCIWGTGNGILSCLKFRQPKKPWVRDASNFIKPWVRDASRFLSNFEFDNADKSVSKKFPNLT